MSANGLGDYFTRNTCRSDLIRPCDGILAFRYVRPPFVVLACLPMVVRPAWRYQIEMSLLVTTRFEKAIYDRMPILGSLMDSYTRVSQILPAQPTWKDVAMNQPCNDGELWSSSSESFTISETPIC